MVLISVMPICVMSILATPGLAMRYFDRACTDGVVLGEQPWLEFPISPKVSHDRIISPDGKWFAIYEKDTGKDAIQLYQVTQTAVVLKQRVSLDNFLSNDYYPSLFKLSNQWLAVASPNKIFLELFNLSSGKRIDTTCKREFLVYSSS